MRENRLGMQMSQFEYAQHVGVNQSQVARWESGSTLNLSQRSREALSEVGVDRVLLGLASLSIEQSAVLVEAARDAILLNSKPI